MLVDTLSVREAVSAAMVPFGWDKSEPLCEFILIQDGRFVGRRFEFEEIQAIWRVDRNYVEFHGPQGKLMQLDLERSSDRKAA